MALIEANVLQGIADRVASQYGYVKVAFDQLVETGGGYYWQRVTATDDPDVEIPLLSQYWNADENLTLDSCVRSGMSQIITVVSLMNTHFSRVGFTGGWDGYCTDKDIVMSDYFNQVHQLARGQYLSANNTFPEEPVSFGTAVIGAGPVVNFTDGDNFGDGDPSNLADGTNFAPTLLSVVVTAFGGVAVDFTIEGKDANNNTQSVDVTIPNTASVGDVINVGTTEKWLDVTNVDYKAATSNQGTVGDAFNVLNVKPRQVQL